MTRPQVLYNGSCPICRREIDHYRRLDQDDGDRLVWRDITRFGGEALPGGVDAENLRRRLHVVDPHGRLLEGVPAFAQIWEHLPRYRWLAALVRTPVIGGIAGLAYEPVAKALYMLDRRRRRRDSGAVRPV